MANFIAVECCLVKLLLDQKFNLLVEKTVEVITSLDWQNALISLCHDGLSLSIQSIPSSGHLSMYTSARYNL